VIDYMVVALVPPSNPCPLDFGRLGFRIGTDNQAWLRII
jgi:hypothetical protein